MIWTSTLNGASVQRQHKVSHNVDWRLSKALIYAPDAQHNMGNLSCNFIQLYSFEYFEW